MALWWQPGDDTPGLVSRCERVAGTMRDLLGDEGQELYLLSSKLIAKEPEEGGAFAWHQVHCRMLHSGSFRFILLIVRIMDIFTRTVFCSQTAALWAWPYTGVTGKLRYKLQYPASTLSRQNINNHSLNKSIIQGEWLPPDHPSLSPAGPPESPEDGGSGLCGPGEAGGHHQGPGGAGHGGDQPRGCPLLPQVSCVFTFTEDTNIWTF